jgi:hypothetical protein
MRVMNGFFKTFVGASQGNANGINLEIMNS